MIAAETCQWCEQALPDCACAEARDRLAFEHAVFDSWHVGQLAEDLRIAEDGRTFVLVKALVEMGVPKWFAIRARIGRMRVRERGSRWEPEESGVWRLILPVTGPHGELIDLVAMSSSDASKWTLRTGDGFLLGAELLADAEWASGAAWFRRANGLGPDPEVAAAVTLRLHGTPLALLRALPEVWPEGEEIPLTFDVPVFRFGGVGHLCVLDWRPAALSALRGLGPEVTLLADDGAAAQRLHELLQWGGLPEIKVAPRERRLAA